MLSSNQENNWQQRAVANQPYGKNLVHDANVSPQLKLGSSQKHLNVQLPKSAQQRTQLNEQMFDPGGKPVFDDDATNLESEFYKTGPGQLPTEQPFVFNPEQIAGMNRASQVIGNRQQQQQLPNGLPQGNTLPSQTEIDNRPGGGGAPMFDQQYMDLYKKQTGYLKDDDPRMVKRRGEAEEVQAGRMKFIKDSQAGMYGNDARGSGIATSGMRASDARGSGDSDFDKRHARQNKIADAATMNAQANAMRAQQGGELGQAELVNRAQQAQLGRQSAERIAGAKSDQANTLAQRKSALDQEKLSGDIKHRAGAIMNLPNYRNLVAAINSKKLNSPGWQAAKEEFLRSTGMDFDTHNSVVAPKLNQGF